MASLLDIGPLTKTVNIRGTDFAVQGLSALVIFDMLRDSPAVQKMFLEKRMNENDLTSLIALAPEFVGGVIASAVGEHGNKEVQAFAVTKLAAGEQLELLEATVNLSFPKGLTSAMEALTRLMRSSEQAAPTGGAAGTK
jgi:hypothetical protein